MATTSQYAIYYDEPSDLALGQTQAKRQANSVETALGTLEQKINTAVESKASDVKAFVESAINGLRLDRDRIDREQSARITELEKIAPKVSVLENLISDAPGSNRTWFTYLGSDLSLKDGEDEVNIVYARVSGDLKGTSVEAGGIYLFFYDSVMTLHTVRLNPLGGGGSGSGGLSEAEVRQVVAAMLRDNGGGGLSQQEIEQVAQRFTASLIPVLVPPIVQKEIAKSAVTESRVAEIVSSELSKRPNNNGGGSAKIIDNLDGTYTIQV